MEQLTGNYNKQVVFNKT